MTRRRIVVGVLGLAIVGCATQAACRKSEGAKMDLTVEEYAPARGADRMVVSANGKFLALQYNFGGASVQPLVKVLERDGGKVVAHARGELAGAPNDDGEAFYVAADLAHPALRSTKRADFSVALEPGEGPDESQRKLGIAPESVWRAYRTRSRVIVQRTDAGSVANKQWWASIDPATGKIGATQKVAEGAERRFVMAAPAGARLVVSEAVPSQGFAGFLAALDEHTLETQWKTPWGKGAYAEHPALGATADGALAVAFTGNGLHVVDGAKGTTVATVPFVEIPVATLDVEPWPGKQAVLIYERSDNQRVPMGLNAAEVAGVELPSGKTSIVWKLPAANAARPGAFALAGAHVLLAPAGKPRDMDPSTWGPEVAPYMK